MSEINSDIKLDKISEDKKFGLILTLKIKKKSLFDPHFLFLSYFLCSPGFEISKFRINVSIFLSDLLVLTLYLSLFRNTWLGQKVVFGGISDQPNHQIP